ncbi:hypothetical protein A3Q39_04600 [Streptococcus sp. CCUG 49591]|nr:hypothetical protein A3Q39_04600 [Streptococcus sp. CCUG 49591]
MKDLLLIPVIFFSSRRNYHSFMETLSYCQWTFPYWFCQFSYFRRGLWNIFVLYRDQTLHGRFGIKWIIWFYDILYYL